MFAVSRLPIADSRKSPPWLPEWAFIMYLLVNFSTCELVNHINPVNSINLLFLVKWLTDQLVNFHQPNSDS